MQHLCTCIIVDKINSVRNVPLFELFLLYFQDSVHIWITPHQSKCTVAIILFMDVQTVGSILIKPMTVSVRLLILKPIYHSLPPYTLLRYDFLKKIRVYRYYPRPSECLS